MYALFCFTVGWIAFALLAQREPTLTARDGDKPYRVIYMLLLCQIATAYAVVQVPGVVGKTVIAALFELATIDFWVLTKVSRARYIYARVSYIRELVAKERGEHVWIIPRTVDFLVIPSKDGTKKKVSLEIQLVKKLADYCTYIATALMYIAVILRFVFTFPDITKNMFSFFYAIIVMSAAFAIALYDESTAAPMIKKEKEHRLAMIKKRYPNVKDLTPRQYELANMAVFGYIYRAIFLMTFAQVGTLGVILTGICYGIIKCWTAMV